jgi:hypothetical protein
MFWQLVRPEYESDYENSYINGSLEHPFGLPGVECTSCDATWGSNRILPYSLPQELCEGNRFRSRWPISDTTHKTMRDEIAHALEERGYKVDGLQPGDDFQPAYLDIPSWPSADFLWCSLGSVVVAERIENLLTNASVTGAVFCPVTLRRVGKRSANLPPPVPNTGEPEDIINEVELLESVDKVGQYYEMIITAKSQRPPGAEVYRICAACGREIYNSETRRLVMRPDMWRGDGVFFLATTLWIVVTEAVKQILEAASATNVNFVPLASG